mgnify:CR=1 FL=1
MPWAPVFGNHEPETEVDKNWIMDEFLKAENCIFNYGDNKTRNKDLAKGPNNIDGVARIIPQGMPIAKPIITTIATAAIITCFL